jgi:hypothetical protein
LFVISNIRVILLFNLKVAASIVLSDAGLFGREASRRFYRRTVAIPYSALSNSLEAENARVMCNWLVVRGLTDLRYHTEGSSDHLSDWRNY